MLLKVPEAEQPKALRALDCHDEVLDRLKTILLRLDLEPVEAVFPCSAMREDIRALIAKAEAQR
jgi:hypothetical protein